MSYISALVNQNRIIRKTVTTPVVASSSTTQKSIVIPEWPVYATITSIQVVANAHNVNSITIKAVSDAAAYLAASGATAAAMVYNTWSGSNAAPSCTYDGANTYVEDATKVGFLHLVLSAPSISAGTSFTIIVEGKEAVPNNKTDEQQVPFINDPSFRVLTGIGGVIKDETIRLTGRGVPYGIDSINNSQSILALGSVSDYIYIGAKSAFSKIAFFVPSTFVEPTGVTLVPEYWNGSGWTAATVQDNTSDNDNIAPSTMSQSGVMNITGVVGWQAQNLSTDPLYIQTQAIIAGNQVPTILPKNYPMYWFRFKITGGTFSPLNLVKIMLVR